MLAGSIYSEAVDVEELQAQEGAQLPNLPKRFQHALTRGEAAFNGGFTDAGIRLGNLLKALAKVPSSVLEPHSWDWLPLFLQYAAAKPGGRQTGAAADEPVEEAGEGEADGNGTEADVNGEPAVAASSLAAQPATVAEVGSGDQARRGRLGNNLWRAQLREWLALLAGVRGVRGLAQAPQLQQAVAAQLLDTESEVQQAALRCLKVFKLGFLSPYVTQCLQLASDKSLREGIVGFPLALGADGSMLPEHRRGLDALLARLLLPKVLSMGK
eukprot:jgi/Astpho2/212/Aster-x0014